MIPNADEHAKHFINSTDDCYAILQLKDIPETVYMKYLSLDLQEKYNHKLEPALYEYAYSGDLPAFDKLDAFLESVYTRFNSDRPADFYGHSLSVSDIVAIRQGNMISYHYCDSFGFKELDNFTVIQNYLRNAEMSMEDDYSMVDGIINNGKAAQIEEPVSVIEQLKEKSSIPKERTKPAKTKCEER